MYRLHSDILQEFPQGKPVMACWLHAGDYGSFAVFLRYVLHPCFECLESGLCVAELQRFLCILVVAPVKCPGIVSFTSHINSNN